MPSSKPTRSAVLESYARKPGQTFESASRDTGRAKSTVHTTVHELVDEGDMRRGNCPTCGGPTYTPTKKAQA